MVQISAIILAMAQTPEGMAPRYAKRPWCDSITIATAPAAASPKGRWDSRRPTVQKPKKPDQRHDSRRPSTYEDRYTRKFNCSTVAVDKQCTSVGRCRDGEPLSPCLAFRRPRVPISDSMNHGSRPALIVMASISVREAVVPGRF